LPAAAPPLYLEIIEGPGVGLKVPLRRPTVIGRGEEADLLLDNMHTSCSHARITPRSDDCAFVEDLESSNGTFVNHVAVHAPTQMSVGDELVVGLSVFTLRTGAEVDRRATAVHPVPGVLASPERPRQYIPPTAFRVPAKSAQLAELERLLDVNVKFRARTAPLAVLVLVALVLCVYFGAR
jgi:pSer/pThr/pTyr-binding forkhead associated (FHA) protein